MWRVLLVLAGGTALFGQGPPDLKGFLNLSDSQIQGLVQLQQQKGQTLQPIAVQASQTQQKLQEALASTNPDPAVVGKLVITMAGLGRQIQQIAATFEQQATNVLQPDQKAKLPPLRLALELHSVALQAMSLGLFNP